MSNQPQKSKRQFGAIGQPDGPTPEELEDRRNPQFIIDPKEVSTKDETRARSWAHTKMSAHESKLTCNCKQNEILAMGDIEPEDVDIRSIYNFRDMHWIIYRRDGILYRGGPVELLFHIILIAKVPQERGRHGHSILFKTSFASL